MRWAAMHEQEDDPFGFGWKMQTVLRLGMRFLLLEQGRKHPCAESIADIF